MLRLSLTPALRAWLAQAQTDDLLPEDARRQAGELAASDAAAWDGLKAVHAAALSRSRPSPSLKQLCAGGGVVPPQRPKPAGKPPELEDHLDRLRRRLEQQRYDAMVQDVTAQWRLDPPQSPGPGPLPQERAAKAAAERGLPTYRKQISFGLHVLVTMGAFYAFGHVAGMGITSNRTCHPMLGLLCMVFGLLLETTLYIIRTTAPPPEARRPPPPPAPAPAAQAAAAAVQPHQRQQPPAKESGMRRRPGAAAAAQPG